MSHIPNRNARAYVADKLPFTGSNLTGFSSNQGALYVVQSYGPHWPLLVFDHAARLWIENSERYHAPTTRRHAALVRQPNITRFMPTDELISLIRAGSLANYVAQMFTA